MSFTSDLLVGLAEYLNAAGVATWRPVGAYGPTETAIRLYDVPQSPDRVVTLTPYVIGDDVRTVVSTQGIQIRSRGKAHTDPRDVQDLDDRSFALLHAAEHVLLGGVHVDSISRRSSLLLGADASGRWEITSSYALTLNRPTVWRTQ